MKASGKIPATISADGRSGKNARASFDATAWFLQATADELEALRNIGWGGDYEADHVAYWFEGESTPEGRAVARVLAAADQGFEVRIDPDAAEAFWRSRNTAAVDASTKGRIFKVFNPAKVKRRLMR